MRILRERTGKNQRQLGEEIGVTDQTVSNWEKGNSNPRLDPVGMLKLCRALGCTLEELADAYSTRSVA